MTSLNLLQFEVCIIGDHRNNVGKSIHEIKTKAFDSTEKFLWIYSWCQAKISVKREERKREEHTLLMLLKKTENVSNALSLTKLRLLKTS